MKHKKDTTNVKIMQPDEQKMLSLEEIILMGARERVMIELLNERSVYLDEHKHLLTDSNLQAIVANGFGKERKINSPVGDVNVACPRTRNRGNILREDGFPENFESKIIPPYMKRSLSIEETIPLLYLYGLSTQDFLPALKNLLGDDAKGLSASNISKMMNIWSDDIEEWRNRDLSEKDYCYVWVDGIYVKVRLEENDVCLLVMIGATREGKKELIGISSGYRESGDSWSVFLRYLRSKGLKAPKLFIGDGSLGFWKAAKDVFPGVRWQRCWVHKTANVLDKLPKSLQPQAKGMIHEIYLAPTKKEGNAAFDQFIEVFKDKYPKAVKCLEKDREHLMTFFDFPAAHWKHIRSTNVIESTFATVRLRQRKTRGNGSRVMAEAMVFKLIERAETRWQRLCGYNMISKVIEGVKFVDGLEQKAA